MSARGRRDLLRPPAGRRAGGARSSARSRCRPRARAPDACRPPEDELGRAAADVDDQERPGIRSGGELAGRAGERQRGLLVAGDDLGLDAERLGRPSGRTRPRCRRRGWRWWRRTAPRSAPSSGDGVRVVAQRGEGALQRLGREAPGAVDALAEPDDLHPPVDVGQHGRVRVDVGDEQPDRVRAAVDRRDPRSLASSGHGRRRARRLDAGPASHHAPRRRAPRRRSGLTPRPGGERVRDQHVQALDPVGHAAGRLMPVDLGHASRARSRRAR